MTEITFSTVRLHSIGWKALTDLLMDLKELIRSIDIVEYISQYVELEQKGQEYWGLSPFKSEKTPSFSVRKEANSFYDFSSGLGGNVFTFTKHYFHCSSKRAVEILQKYAGVSDIETVRSMKMTATEICKRFSVAKTQKKTGKNKELPDRVMEKYELAPEKLAVWCQEGISEASLARFQVRYDGFSDRLVYPIRNAEGKIVNIGGRTLDPDWKEKKLRKYSYFYSWDGGLDVVYGLFENMESILEQHEVILFEGCKSVLLADTYGVHNTGAILTSHLNPMQMKLLARLGCRVVFALDKDVDVRLDHNIQKLKRYVEVMLIEDRDDLLQEKDSPVDQGSDTFRLLYNQKKKLR